MTMSTIEDFYTVQDAAAELGVSGTCIRRLCIEHEIGEKVTEHLRLLTEEDLARLREIRKEGERPEGSLTVSEVAEQLEVSVGRIRQLCIEYDLGERIGRFKYLTEEEVAQILNSRKKPGRPKTQN